MMSTRRRLLYKLAIPAVIVAVYFLVVSVDDTPPELTGSGCIRRNVREPEIEGLSDPDTLARHDAYGALKSFTRDRTHYPFSTEDLAFELAQVLRETEDPAIESDMRKFLRDLMPTSLLVLRRMVEESSSVDGGASRLREALEHLETEHRDRERTRDLSRELMGR